MATNLVVIRMAISLKDQNFYEELVATDKIVLVVFYDERSGNHYLIEPGLAKLDGQYDQQVKFCRINTRENPMTAERFRVFTSPTILFFHRGKLIEVMAGTFPKVEVENTIRKLINEINQDGLSPSEN